MNIFLKLKNFLGRVYRSVRGVGYNKLERIVEPKKDIDYRVIGKTIEQRNIMCYEVGKGHQSILWLGGVHGNEVGTVKLAYRILDWCYLNKKLFENSLRIYVVPCLNMDGYERARIDPNYMNNGRMGRLNANGVDLNRNFPTKDFRQYSYWFRGKGYSERQEVYCGSHGGSELETQSLIEFVKNDDIKLIFALHNVGSDVMGDDASEFMDALGRVYAKYAKFEYINESEWQHGKAQTGTFKGWCEENGISNMIIEASNRWGSDWRRQRKAVEMVIRELAGKEF